MQNAANALHVSELILKEDAGRERKRGSGKRRNVRSMETVGCGVGLKVPSGDESGVGSGVVGSGVGSVVGLRVSGQHAPNPCADPRVAAVIVRTQEPF